MAGGRLARKPEGRDLNRSIEVSETTQTPARGADVRHIKDVVLVGGVQKRVAHGLGRRPQTWIAMRPRSAASVTSTYPLERAIDDKYLTIENPADLTVDLLVW
jgi:hypothetical protein